MLTVLCLVNVDVQIVIYVFYLFKCRVFSKLAIVHCKKGCLLHILRGVLTTG